MSVSSRQRIHSQTTRQNFANRNQKIYSNYQSSKSNRQLSPQIKIYNRNVYLREAYKALIAKNYEQQIKQLANCKKVDDSSYKILKDKILNNIESTLKNIFKTNEQDHKQQLTYEQMCQVVFSTNQWMRRAQKSVEVQQLLSQLWLYLKNYQIQNQYLDGHIFGTFLKILMDPKGIKPSQIKHLMFQVQPFQKSNQLKISFLEKYPQLQEQALDDIQIFKLWYSVKQKYRLFVKSESQHSLSRRSLFKNQCTFQPQISQNSRIYAQKSLKKYLSSNRLTHERSININATNEEENELQEYLSQKHMPNAYQQNYPPNRSNEATLSYHELLYKRKLQKEDLSRVMIHQKSQQQDQHLKQNTRKAPPSQIKQIVDKLYFVPQKRQDLNYKEIMQEKQLRQFDFRPKTNQYYNYGKKNQIHVNGFQKQVDRLKKGREQKQKLKEIYDNLGKPKNLKRQARTPSMLQRDVPKLILQVNIGGGRVQKIKLHGNQDPKIVAKKFINKHSLESSMMSVLEQLIDENLKNL